MEMIRQAIVDAIQASGRTLVDLGREASIHPQHISDYRHSRRDFVSAKAGRLLAALGLTITRTK